MKKKSFAKFLFIDENRVVGVIEQPDGVAFEGTTYYPESGESITQRTVFSREATVGLFTILQEWMADEPEKLCRNCAHISDEGHELDPLGEWKWCKLWGKDVLEDTYGCDDGWEERELIWPNG